MIDKFKTIMAADTVIKQITEKLDGISERMAKAEQAFGSMHTAIGSLNAEFAALKKIHSELAETSAKTQTAVQTVLDELRNEVYQFKLLKSQVQAKLLAKFEEELTKELAHNRQKLEEDLGYYSDVRKNTEAMVAAFTTLQPELQKLVAVSAGIKKEDFELAKFAHHLQEADRDKLYLMRRIEKLESVISQMRRREPQRGYGQQHRYPPKYPPKSPQPQGELK